MNKMRQKQLNMVMEMRQIMMTQKQRRKKKRRTFTIGNNGRRCRKIHRVIQINTLQVNEDKMEEPKVDFENQLKIDDVEEIEVDTENLEENISFDESKNILKLNENRILFYKLYMLFNEQIKTHQMDSILGKLGDMDVSYDKFIDFINNEDEEFYGEEKFILN